VALLVSGLLLLTLVLSGCGRKQTTASAKATLTIYGLDNSEVMAPIIKAYGERQPGVKVVYKKYDNRENYESLLINEIAEGEGPDIFYLHNNWLPRHVKKLVPLESETLTPETFSAAFVDVASDDLIQADPRDGVSRIFALPLYVDSLALYYNKSQFEQAVPERGRPAPTWAELAQDAATLRRESADFDLLRGSIALGRGDNIATAPDIFYAMVLQSGTSFYDSTGQQARFASGVQRAFEQFVAFATASKSEYSWSKELVSADLKQPELEAFLRGDVSAIMAYSDLFPRLENELKNVKSRAGSVIQLRDIKVAPLPQFSEDEREHRTLASYDALAVSRTSKNPAIAWDFVQFATSKSSAQSYHDRTRRPAARRDLIEDQKKEPFVDVFVSQVGYAETVPVLSESSYSAILRAAFTQAADGQNARSALAEAQTAITELLKAELPEGLYPKK